MASWTHDNLGTQGYCLPPSRARQLTGAPPLPPNPTRRRHAFKLATVWLAGVAILFAAGAATAVDARRRDEAIA